MWSSSRNRCGLGRAARALLVAAFFVLTACAPSSRALTLLGESEPIVREAAKQRAELSRRDDPTGLLVRKGGCPVCQW
jgi:hypothetical protein